MPEGFAEHVWCNIYTVTSVGINDFWHRRDELLLELKLQVSKTKGTHGEAEPAVMQAREEPLCRLAPLSESEKEQIFQHYDHDHNGTLNFDEVRISL